MTVRRVRFLGIGRRVEVGERSRDRAAIVTFKSDLPEHGVELLACLSDDALSMSLLYPLVWMASMGCPGCPKFALRPTDLCDALPDIGQASTDLLAI